MSANAADDEVLNMTLKAAAEFWTAGALELSKLTEEDLRARDKLAFEVFRRVRL